MSRNVTRLPLPSKNERWYLMNQVVIVISLSLWFDLVKVRYENADLRNNKDAQKLKRMGSDLGIESYIGRCPTCGQEIEDSLLPIQNCEHIMSIEENIRHLEAQKTMISFALDAHRKNVEVCETNLQSLSGRIFTLRRLAKTIRSDY